MVKDHCWTGSHKFPNGTDPHGNHMLTWTLVVVKEIYINLLLLLLCGKSRSGVNGSGIAATPMGEARIFDGL